MNLKLQNKRPVEGTGQINALPKTITFIVPFFIGFINHLGGMKMDIEMKLAYIRKALELGAGVEVKFHGVQNESEAKVIVSELEPMTIPFDAYYDRGEHKNTNWYTADDHENKLETTIFFRKIAEGVTA